MSVHFEERSGVIPCRTPWGSWYQTMEEVFVEVNVPQGTSGKEVKCILGYKQIELHVKGQEIFKVCGQNKWDGCLHSSQGSIVGLSRRVNPNPPRLH